MKTRTIEIAVGVLVALGIASLLMLAMQVSGLSDFYSENSGYKLSAVFKNIGGLKVKSKVTVGGVTVGRVTNITLVADEGEYNPLVEMAIDNNINQIPVDSTASILTAGLLGDNYIGIEIGMDDEFFANNDVITLTNQAILLEDLISKFALNKDDNEKNGD